MAIHVDDVLIRQFEGNDGVGRGHHATVPDPYHSKSGITVATGFDLGTMNHHDLQRLYLPTELIDKLTPYLGKDEHNQNIPGRHGPEALELAKTLHVTKQEADTLNRAHFGDILHTLQTVYDNASPVHFADLPGAAQTIIFSVGLKYGPHLDHKAVTRDFWTHVTHQDWQAAIHDLRTFHDSRAENRHHTEADYLAHHLHLDVGQHHAAPGETRQGSHHDDHQPTHDGKGADGAASPHHGLNPGDGGTLDHQGDQGPLHPSDPHDISPHHGASSGSDHFGGGGDAPSQTPQDANFSDSSGMESHVSPDGHNASSNAPAPLGGATEPASDVPAVSHDQEGRNSLHDSHGAGVYDLFDPSVGHDAMFGGSTSHDVGFDASLSHDVAFDPAVDTPVSYDAGHDAAFGSMTDHASGFDASAGHDAGFDASAGHDAGFDASAGHDAGFDASAGHDAGFDASAGHDAGFDASAGHDVASADIGAVDPSSGASDAGADVPVG